MHHLQVFERQAAPKEGEILPNKRAFVYALNARGRNALAKVTCLDMGVITLTIFGELATGLIILKPAPDTRTAFSCGADLSADGCARGCSCLHGSPESCACFTSRSTGCSENTVACRHDIAQAMSYGHKMPHV